MAFTSPWLSRSFATRNNDFGTVLPPEQAAICNFRPMEGQPSRKEFNPQLVSFARSVYRPNRSLGKLRTLGRIRPPCLWLLGSKRVRLGGRRPRAHLPAVHSICD